jgi:hypothetical protein
MKRAARILVGLGVLLSVAMAGCGAAHKSEAEKLLAVQHTQPYCWPNSKCAKVSVVVEQCGGPAPGRCWIVPVVSVGLFDTGGQSVTMEHAGTGQKLDSFSLLTPVPGRYLLETTVDGYRVKRSIELRLGHTLRTKLIEPVP